jgi:hypothetical protein
MDAKMIGERLRELRGTRTIKDVSDDTGLGWSTICMYELGRRIPEDDNKVVLARYYNTTVQALFYDSDIANSNSI